MEPVDPFGTIEGVQNMLFHDSDVEIEQEVDSSSSEEEHSVELETYFLLICLQGTQVPATPNELPVDKRSPQSLRVEQHTPKGDTRWLESLLGHPGGL